MKYILVFEAFSLYIKIMSVKYCPTFSEKYMERLNNLEDRCLLRYQRRLMIYERCPINTENVLPTL